MPTINVNSVPVGSEVYITGIVDYSHIATRLEGEELKKDNDRKIANGMRAVDKPHTRITVTQAEVLYANPAAPTLAEQYIAERLYLSTIHPEKGKCFTGYNKSRNFPELYCRTNRASMTLERIHAERELAMGVPVTILVRFFASPQNNGVNLEAVIVDEKPVKWINNALTSSLASRGFEIVESSDAVDEIRDQLNTPDYAAAAPYTQPAPAAPAPAPYVQPAPAAYVQPSAAPPVAPSPAAYAQPAAVPPVAPAPAVPVTPTLPAPPTAAAPAAPSRPIPPKGYVYDENGRVVPAPPTGIQL